MTKRKDIPDDQLLTTLLKYADEHFSMTLESMGVLKMELIWLYNQLETKGNESKMRGKEPSKEYLQSIQTIKRASTFISIYCLKLEQMDAKLIELKRQNDHYRTLYPRVDFTKLKRTWNGHDVKYIKDFINDDNY